MPEQFLRVYDYDDAPTIRAFNEDKRFFRMIMGCYGSGKSSGCVAEIIDVGVNQVPDQTKTRRTRWAVIRSTYRQLLDTTMETFFQWLPPEHFGTFSVTNYSYKIDKIVLDDGTKVEIEIIFRALDKPEHVRNLLSLELTGAWFNEIRETPKIIVDNMEGRVNRYPSVMDGGATWAGVIADTNPPDVDSWLYRFFEEKVPKDPELQAKYILFKQPSGRSPQAENRKHLPDNYYTNMAVGKDPEFVKVYVDGDYGYIRDGKPVFSNYADSMHCSEEIILPTKGVPVIISLDFGLSPAAVFSQYMPKGQFNVFNEFTSEDMGIRRFFSDVIKPYIFANLRGYEIIVTGDPAGIRRQDTDERSCFDELRLMGFPATPAHSNSFLARYNAVDNFLTKNVEGKPAFKLSPNCSMLRKGFIGEYKLKKYQGMHEKFSEIPVKNEFSHCLCGETKIATSRGMVNISDVVVGDQVETPLGSKKVSATMNSVAPELLSVSLSNGREILCTPDHPFVLRRGVVRADRLCNGEELEDIGNIAKEKSKWEGQLNILLKNSTVSCFTEKIQDTTKRIIENMERCICTATFGSSTIIPYQQDVLCTTSMGIDQTTTLATYNSCMDHLIPVITRESFAQKTKSKYSKISTLPKKQLSTGTLQTMGRDGIANMPLMVGTKWISKSMFAESVEKNIQLIRDMLKKVFAPPPANQNNAEILGLTTSSVPAQYAKTHSFVISMPKQERAVKVVKVERLAEQRLVYDLTVEDAHCFYANGVLVGNCHDALQYGVMVVDRAANIEKTRTPAQLRYASKYTAARPQMSAWT